MDCLAYFGLRWPGLNCVKSCKDKSVICGFFFFSFGGLKRAHGVTAGKIFPLGSGLGSMMQKMDCSANFGQLQADFNYVKHCKRKVVKS